VGFALASAVVLFVFLVAVWGVSGIFPDGHFGAQANMGIAGYNMSRYGTIYPIFPFLDHPGSSANAYMHHPLGMFWMTGLLIKVLGPENWVLRLPAIVYATLTAFFMYRCGRSIWGPLEGAVATLAYAALPITLGFANFHSLEQPLMLGCLVATWGYARFSQTGRGAYAAASIAGFGFAALHDWEAYVWGATFLFWLFLRFFVVPARLLGSSVDERRAGRYWALMVGTALVTLSITLWLVISSGKLSELMSMYSVRSSGAGLPLRTVLDSRQVRIELMFTGLGIALGKLALPVIVARFFLRRDERELLPLFVFVMAVVQYVVFKQGADVHIFWPHPFTIYFGLAMGSLVAGVRGAWRWLAG
jgi:4-amino-4-deoxy-L-arabinose transferase-like glycosyltransferase